MCAHGSTPGRYCTMEEFRWWTDRPYLDIETSRGGRTAARTIKMKIMMLGLRLINMMTAGRTAHFHFDNAAAAVAATLSSGICILGVLLLVAHGARGGGGRVTVVAHSGGSTIFIINTIIT